MRLWGGPSSSELSARMCDGRTAATVLDALVLELELCGVDRCWLWDCDCDCDCDCDWLWACEGAGMLFPPCWFWLPLWWFAFAFPWFGLCWLCRLCCR
jgi:hypothetical protein